MNKFKFFRGPEQICWKTWDGTVIPLKQIHTGHMQNIMRCLAGLGQMEIPENYLGRCRAEWYDIFLTELKRRRDEGI